MKKLACNLISKTDLDIIDNINLYEMFKPVNKPASQPEQNKPALKNYIVLYYMNCFSFKLSDINVLKYKVTAVTADNAIKQFTCSDLFIMHTKSIHVINTIEVN